MKEKKYLEFIKGFSEISLADICRQLKIDRSNLVTGRCDQRHYRKVKDEIEYRLAKLYIKEREKDVNK